MLCNYSITSADGDNTFRNHIRYTKRDFPRDGIRDRPVLPSTCNVRFTDKNISRNHPGYDFCHATLFKVNSFVAV